MFFVCSPFPVCLPKCFYLAMVHTFHIIRHEKVLLLAQAQIQACFCKQILFVENVPTCCAGAAAKDLPQGCFQGFLYKHSKRSLQRLVCTNEQMCVGTFCKRAYTCLQVCHQCLLQDLNFFTRTTSPRIPAPRSHSSVSVCGRMILGNNNHESVLKEIHSGRCHLHPFKVQKHREGTQALCIKPQRGEMAESSRTVFDGFRTFFGHALRKLRSTCVSAAFIRSFADTRC